jgi:hypothetical protein
VRRADNLTTLVCRLSRNPGALTSRTPQGHVGLFRGYLDLERPPYGITLVYNEALQLNVINETSFVLAAFHFLFSILEWAYKVMIPVQKKTNTVFEFVTTAKFILRSYEVCVTWHWTA